MVKSLAQQIQIVNENLPLQSIDYIAPATDLDSGTSSGGSNTTLIDSTKTWTVDEFVNKVVKINCNNSAVFEYGVVASNTSNTLTFDSELVFAVHDNCDYKILNTLEVPEKFPLIVAFDVRLNDCAILLPKMNSDLERKSIHSYIELADNGDNKVAIVCREGDDFLQQKWGTLEHKFEGVTLYGHNFGRPHYDVISTYNIKRYANGYTTADTNITSTTFEYMGANLNYDVFKRFVEVNDSGQNWIQYTSLIPSEFELEFTALVDKSGGGGSVVDISFNKKTKEGVETLLNTRVSIVSLSAGADKETISFKVPVTLNYGDRVIPTAKRTTGTILLKAGSQVTIRES